MTSMFHRRTPLFLVRPATNWRGPGKALVRSRFLPLMRLSRRRPRGHSGGGAKMSVIVRPLMSAVSST